MAAFTGFIGWIRWIYWLLLAGLLSLDLLAAFAGPSLTVFAAANKLRFLEHDTYMSAFGAAVGRSMARNLIGDMRV